MIKPLLVPCEYLKDYACKEAGHKTELTATLFYRLERKGIVKALDETQDNKPVIETPEKPVKKTRKRATKVKAE